MDLKDRKRSVDITNMTAEEVDIISIQVGQKIRAICDEAVNKANAILNIYGANAKMVIEIDHLPTIMAEVMDIDVKTEKSYKNPNLKANQTSIEEK